MFARAPARLKPLAIGLPASREKDCPLDQRARAHERERTLMTIQFTSVVPILRIFDIAKADEFYQGFLGFKVDWDHRFDDNAPLYRQVSRGDLVLHLSEHHGDGSPGARLRVMMRGVEEFHREISAKTYRYMRPGLEQTPWGTLETGAIDPFGNLIRFCERIDKP
jgi:catechol 2,3-dioxygenase-like lactoylglutathione lyase family enzyme